MLRQQDWVVYAKPPFAGPERVLAYLGSYTHRIAISNSRIQNMENDRVRFRYRDYADDRRMKVMDLAAEEFIRRFLLHVLPTGFVRMRHYGLLANRFRKQRIAQCRELLDAMEPEAPPVEESAVEKLLRLTGVDLLCCPACGQGRMRIVAEFYKHDTRFTSRIEIRDTSRARSTLHAHPGSSFFPLRKRGRVAFVLESISAQKYLSKTGVKMPDYLIARRTAVLLLPTNQKHHPEIFIESPSAGY